MKDHTKHSSQQLNRSLVQSVIILWHEVGVKYYTNLSTGLWKLRTLVCSEHKLQKTGQRKTEDEENKFTDSSVKWSSIPVHEETLVLQFNWQGTMIRDTHLTDVTTLIHYAGKQPVHKQTGAWPKLSYSQTEHSPFHKWIFCN